MTKLTRSGFLKKTSAGAVAIGAIAAVPGAALAGATGRPAEASAATVAGDEPFVVYVRNPAAGEMSLLVGTREIKHVDRELAARLWHARGEVQGESFRAAKSVVR